MQSFQNLSIQAGEKIISRLSIELVYSLIIILLCFWIYYKMKEVYTLTSHKGIGLLRNSFLYFGLAFAVRFIIITVVGLIKFNIKFNTESSNIMMLSTLIILLSYFSTMAIFSLTVSSLWYKSKHKFHSYQFHILALLVASIAFITKFFWILILSQFILMIISIASIFLNHKKTKNVNSLLIIYSLLFIFWLLSLLLLKPGLWLGYLEFKIPVYLIAIGIFSYIAYRINKWKKKKKENDWKLSTISFP